MIGYNAAAIVQVEEHIINARRELHAAMDRLRFLERRVSTDISRKLETIRLQIQEKINDLEIEELLHWLAHAEP